MSLLELLEHYSVYSVCNIYFNNFLIYFLKNLVSHDTHSYSIIIPLCVPVL